MQRFRHMGCDHPMSGMGGIFDSLLDSAKALEQKFRHEGGISNVLQQQVDKQAAELATIIVSDPGVQRAGAEAVEQAALTRAVSALTEQRKQLVADISALTSAPVEFAKANPLKTVAYVAVPVAAIALLYKVLKK